MKSGSLVTKTRVEQSLPLQCVSICQSTCIFVTLCLVFVPHRLDWKTGGQRVWLCQQMAVRIKPPSPLWPGRCYVLWPLLATSFFFLFLKIPGTFPLVACPTWCFLCGDLASSGLCLAVFHAKCHPNATAQQGSLWSNHQHWNSPPRAPFISLCSLISCTSYLSCARICLLMPTFVYLCPVFLLSCRAGMSHLWSAVPHASFIWPMWAFGFDMLSVGSLNAGLCLTD